MQSWRIDNRELEYVSELLKSGFPGHQERSFTADLEKLFAEKFNSKFAISFTNGTATLHAALAAAGIGSGDEVIVPPLTMSSTSLAVLQAGAVPVYADVDPDTFVMSADTLEKVITQRTKAIMPVALYGLPPELDKIMEIARRHNLIVIEDDAQCFGGKLNGKLAGTFGDMASFSFQNSKHITCGEGGMVITSDRTLAEKLRRFSSLGYSCVGAVPGQSKIDKKLIVRYDFVRHVEMGFNYRLNEISAAVALAQLEKLDYFVQWRIRCAEAFAEVIKDVPFLQAQKVHDNVVNSYWAFAVKLTDDRIDWQEFYDKFCEFGGDGFYGAWCLSYDEPFFEKIIPVEHKNCPVADALQPRLIQFKTNYGNEEKIARECKALSDTINYFRRQLNED